MASSPIQLQWELGHTADSALSVARGILQAATSDNVQVLALLACEEFGATLAMCPETCNKIERLVRRSPTSAVLNFIPVIIGYSAHDCASQFVLSLAGIQFLALAASLVTTVGPYEGGNALEAMLKKSAADKKLLPSARQLRDLLASLEHRCVLSGFADSVVGWQMFLSELPQSRLWNYPSVDGLEKLVDAFRQLSKIGDNEPISVTVTTATCAPWVIAFTKWCLGIPPKIQLRNRSLLVQPTSRVTVMISPADSPEFEIKIYRKVATPADLITASIGPEPFSGMISVECYGQWLGGKCGFASGSGRKALSQALSYALEQVVNVLQLSQYKEFDHSVPLSEWQKESHDKQIDEDILPLAANPFPTESTISGTLSRILGTAQSSQLISLKEGNLVGDLPLVELHIQHLEKLCTCLKCNPLGTTSYKSCEVDMFFSHLTDLVADILALSLFDCSEKLLVHLNHKVNRSGGDTFKKAIHSILTTGLPSLCSVTDFLHWALALVGHNVSEDVQNCTWVISCFKGQAVYPKLFETQDLEKRGYLTLSWALGLLRYDGEVYERGVGVHTSANAEDHITSHPQNNVTIPLNLLPGYGLVWRVTHKNGFLEVNLGLEGPDNNHNHVVHAPFRILTNLASALVLEVCRHDANCSLRNPDWFCAYTGPISPMTNTENTSRKVGLVAVDGNDGLRMFALSAYPSPFPFILRGKSCLSCSLAVSQRTNYPVIIC